MYTYRLSVDLDEMTYKVHLGINDNEIRIFKFHIPERDVVQALGEGRSMKMLSHKNKNLTIPRALFVRLDEEIMQFIPSAA